MTDIVEISGIGPSAKALLIEHGFDSVESIASTTAAKLSQVPGFGPARSKTVILSAKALIAASPSAEVTSKKEKNKDKKKDKKKGKKKDKKKEKKKNKKGKNKK